LNYVVEWCETEKTQQKGFALLDSIVIYKDDEDAEQAQIQFEGTRSPDMNIYIAVHVTVREMGDPFLQVHVERGQRLLKQTYWANAPALRFHQGCLAMTTRGHNVDEMCPMLGPGGVGLSLVTKWLLSIYGTRNHKVYDPNVFFSDDELRKVVEDISTSIIQTAQERPTGQRQSIREDLLKKFITGEFLSGRLPYGILTKMFKVEGWERLECNKVLQFHGITEKIFQSIVRRFGVMVVKCRLMDKDWLEKYLPDHEKYGIFVREPDLQTWVESGPGRAAGLLLQLDFEKRCGGESGCRKITRSYTQLGGDHGVTRQVMREACGLKPDVGNATGDSVLHNLLKDFAGDAHNVGVVYHDRMEMPEEMVALQQYYVKSMISKKLDHLTPGYVSKIPAPLFVDCAKGEIFAKLSQMKDAWTSAKAAAMARTTGGRPANVDMFLICYRAIEKPNPGFI
jgi:hypothetical protein